MSTGAEGQKELQRACAKITVGDARLGTGFLVAPDLVLTCWHVVLSEEDACTCVFEGGFSTNARLVSYHKDIDVALLRLDNAVHAVAPLRLAQRSDDPRWVTFCFPAFANGAGVFLRGTIDAWRGLDADRNEAILLHSDRFDPSTPMGGISGSPILSGTHVVGVLYRVLGAAGERKVPHLGLCYAVPVALFPQSLRDAMGVLLLDATAAADASLDVASEDAIQRRADAYVTIQKGATPEAVLTALHAHYDRGSLAIAAVDRLISLGAEAAAASVVSRLPPGPPRDWLQQRSVASRYRRMFARVESLRIHYLADRPGLLFLGLVHFCVWLAFVLTVAVLVPDKKYAGVVALCLLPAALLRPVSALLRLRARFRVAQALALRVPKDEIGGNVELLDEFDAFYEQQLGDRS